MRNRVIPEMLLSLALSLAFASGARADDPCAAFTGNVERERTLFGQEAQRVAAANVASAAPVLMTDRLYQLQLVLESQVTFVTQPGKKMPDERQTYAGLARVTVETGGMYRIALDQGLWVDVIARDLSLQARAFQGRPGCNAPHKIVEFLLPAGTPVLLQFSGAHAPAVKVSVTRSPAG